MKEFYTAPEMEIVRFAPVEKIANDDLVDGLSLEGDFVSNRDHEGGGADF